MQIIRAHFLLIAKVVLVWLSFSGITYANEQKAVIVCERVSDIKEMLDSYRGNRSVLMKAELMLNATIRINPTCAPAYKELARFHIMNGHKSSSQISPTSLGLAEQALDSALEIDPDYANAYVLFGHLYRLMNKHNKAISSLEKAKIIGTDSPWLYLNWAQLMIDEGNNDVAAQYYQRVINSNTDNRKAMSSAYEGLIKYYISIGDLDNASNTYLSLLQYDDKSAWAYGNYATFLLYKKGDYEEAIKYSRMALELMDYGVGREILAASLYRKWAEFLINQDNAQAGQQYYDEAFSIYPNTQRIADYAKSSPNTMLTFKALNRINGAE